VAAIDMMMVEPEKEKMVVPDGMKVPEMGCP
jgi:hypothetical protein